MTVSAPSERLETSPHVRLCVSVRGADATRPRCVSVRGAETVSPPPERLFSPSVSVRGAETRHASELAAFLHFLLFYLSV